MRARPCQVLQGVFFGGRVRHGRMARAGKGEGVLREVQDSQKRCHVPAVRHEPAQFAVDLRENDAR